MAPNGHDLITDIFPNFCPHFQLRIPTQEGQILIPDWTHRMPPFYLVHLQLPQANSLQSRCTWSLLFFYYTTLPLLCLPLSLCQNVSDIGWPCCGKIRINSLCLFSLRWSSFVFMIPVDLLGNASGTPWRGGKNWNRDEGLAWIPTFFSQKEALRAQKEAVLGPGFLGPVGNRVVDGPPRSLTNLNFSARAKAEGVWNLNFPPTAWFYLC